MRGQVRRRQRLSGDDRRTVQRRPQRPRQPSDERPGNQYHTRCLLPARARQVAKVFVFGRRFPRVSNRESKDVLVVSTGLDLDNRQYVVSGGAKCGYNRVVATLVGENAHILFLFAGVSLADKHDFFTSKRVRCVAHRRMEVMRGSTPVRLEQIAFGRTFAELAEQ